MSGWSPAASRSTLPRRTPRARSACATSIPRTAQRRWRGSRSSSPRRRCRVRRLHINGEFLPVVQNETSKVLFDIYRTAAKDAGLPNLDGEFAGGCADSGFTASVGTPTICAVGPVGPMPIPRWNISTSTASSRAPRRSRWRSSGRASINLLDRGGEAAFARCVCWSILEATLRATALTNLLQCPTARDRPSLKPPPGWPQSG